MHLSAIQTMQMQRVQLYTEPGEKSLQLSLHNVNKLGQFE